jgi:hypothetical protein
MGLRERGTSRDCCALAFGWDGMGRGAVGGGGGDQTGDPWVTPLPRRGSQDSLSRPAGVLVSRFRWEMLVLEEVGLGELAGKSKEAGEVWTEL